MKVFGFGDFSTQPGKGDGGKPKKPKGKIVGVGFVVKAECSKCREERVRRNRRFAKPSLN